MWYKRGYKEPTPKEIEELIEKIAQATIKTGFEILAIIFLEGYKPISRIGTTLGVLTVSPFVTLVIDLLGKEKEYGERSFHIWRFFQNKNNISRLIDRIEEIVKEKDIEKKKLKEKNREEGKRKEKLLSRIRKSLRI